MYRTSKLITRIEYTGLKNDEFKTIIKNKQRSQVAKDFFPSKNSDTLFVGKTDFWGPRQNALN